MKTARNVRFLCGEFDLYLTLLLWSIARGVSGLTVVLKEIAWAEKEVEALETDMAK